MLSLKFINFPANRKYIYQYSMLSFNVKLYFLDKLFKNMIKDILKMMNLLYVSVSLISTIREALKWSINIQVIKVWKVWKISLFIMPCLILLITKLRTIISLIFKPISKIKKECYLEFLTSNR